MNPSTRTELRRMPQRGSREWETISQILDAGFLAHVGFCVDTQPLSFQPYMDGREKNFIYTAPL